MKTVSYSEFERLFLENAYRNAVPVNAAFELTPLCNLDCKMCYVHLQDPAVRQRLLSGEQWIAIMDGAVRQGMISALLTGGEALTHPDFRKIYEHLADNGISISLKSNGVLLEGENLALLKRIPPSTLDVSMYGCDGASFRAVTGRDLFERVDRNLRAALEAELPLRLMVTPSVYMLPRIREVLEYAGSFGVETRVNVYLGEPYDNTGRKKEDFDLTADEVIRIQRLAEEILPSAQAVTLDDEEEPEKRTRPEGAGEGDALRCAAGRTRFAVSWEGDMLPCLQFPKGIISASIPEMGVKKAWEKVHESVLAYRVPAECGACAFFEDCCYCLIKHGRAAFRGQCDPAVCELEKRLIAMRKEGEKEK